MSEFLKGLSSLINKNNFNVYSVAEVCCGRAEEVNFEVEKKLKNSYSVAKAFVVTAIGFLFDEGKITLEDRVVEILKEYLPKNIDKRYNELTVHQTLRHSIGLPEAYLDIDVYEPSAFGTDYLENIFCAPPTYEVGKEEIYTDAAYYILARVVEKISGESLESFLQSRLFAQLEFGDVVWSKCPMGHAMGATGLYLTSADMAKLGVVYLQNGVYDNKRIISKKWVDVVLRKGYELRDLYQGKCYGKGGMYNQMLLVVPSQNRVVSWHAYDEGDFSPLIEWICKYGQK